MSKADVIEVEGVVVEKLPNCLLYTSYKGEVLPTKANKEGGAQ